VQDSAGHFCSAIPNQRDIVPRALAGGGDFFMEEREEAL
jgi:hypothetical protein